MLGASKMFTWNANVQTQKQSHSLTEMQYPFLSSHNTPFPVEQAFLSLPSIADSFAISLKGEGHQINTRRSKREKNAVLWSVVSKGFCRNHVSLTHQTLFFPSILRQQLLHNPLIPGSGKWKKWTRPRVHVHESLRFLYRELTSNIRWQSSWRFVIHMNHSIRFESKERTHSNYRL